jgi:hypothetical protein
LQRFGDLSTVITEAIVQIQRLPRIDQAPWKSRFHNEVDAVIKFQRRVVLRAADDSENAFDEYWWSFPHRGRDRLEPRHRQNEEPFLKHT